MYTMEEFDEWRVSLKIHLSSLHEHIWIKVEQGPYIPMVRNTDYSNDGSEYTLPRYIPKDREDFSRYNFKLSNLDSISLNKIMNNLGRSVFPKVKNHTNYAKGLREKIDGTISRDRPEPKE